MNKLTNIDICNRLLEIRQLDNICDREEALYAFNKEYKHSPFYHKTHRSLRSLYLEVTVENLLTLRSLLASVQHFLDNLDTERFMAMLDQVNTETLATATQSTELLKQLGILDIINKKPN